MKLIIAIIQPGKLESVKQALTEVEVFRLTVMDVQGFGRQRGHAEIYRGHEIAVNLLRKVQLQIAVNDEFVEPTISAIVKGGRSGDRGEIGDGKIFEFVLVSAAAKPSKNFLQLTMRTSVTTVFSRGDADAIGGMRLRQFD